MEKKKRKKTIKEISEEARQEAERDPVVMRLRALVARGKEELRAKGIDPDAV